jgi:hypothetical protein
MKHLTVVILLLNFFSASNLEVRKDSCIVLLETISGHYTGKCLNGLAHGKGKATGEDSYSGMFREGLPHGKGKYIYQNGDVYQGSFKNGLKDGQGKLVFMLDGKKHTLTGFWKNGDFVGTTDPDVPYRVLASSGVPNYKIEKLRTGSQNGEVYFSISSAFQEYIPGDLKIEKSSGQHMQKGKGILFTQYYKPFHCEISYTILVGENRKQCRFIFEIADEGNYKISLYND